MGGGWGDKGTRESIGVLVEHTRRLVIDTFVSQQRHAMWSTMFGLELKNNGMNLASRWRCVAGECVR